MFATSHRRATPSPWQLAAVGCALLCAVSVGVSGLEAGATATLVGEQLPRDAAAVAIGDAAAQVARGNEATAVLAAGLPTATTQAAHGSASAGQTPATVLQSEAVSSLASMSEIDTDAEYLCPNQNSTEMAELPQLRIEMGLTSTRERLSTDITLVTQLSFERLYMLEGQCDVWSGIISAAVYVAKVDGQAVVVELSSNQDPRLVPLASVASRVRAFHAAAESKGLCKLDLQLVSQDVESVWLSALYPVNAMRNRALAAARTDVVLLLDVDFWPSAELGELASSARKYASLREATAARNAIVLPAFETRDSGGVGVEAARDAALDGKNAAAKMFRDGRLKAFHADRYRAGHRATDYGKWLEASRPYRVRYEEGYEPYILVARAAVPWYDERFVGYRKNKVVHLLHLASLGVQFVIHPHAFAVHAPHPRARTWKVTHTTGLWEQLAAMYDGVRSRVREGVYVPASRYSCDRHVVGPLIVGLDG